jgi:hypothetical protein
MSCPSVGSSSLDELHNDNKNRLQEHHYKYKYPPPQYVTSRCGGKDNAALWQSTVTIYNHQVFVGNPQKTKTLAEKSAAYLALSHLGLLLQVAKFKTVYDRPTVILIDLENLPKFVNDIPAEDFENPNLTVYAFVGVDHPLAEKFNHQKVTKVLSPSNRPDGCDACIQVYAGMMLTQNKFEYYIIATRDHFGYALADMIECHHLGWIGRECKVITDYCKI